MANNPAFAVGDYVVEKEFLGRVEPRQIEAIEFGLGRVRYTDGNFGKLEDLIRANQPKPLPLGRAQIEANREHARAEFAQLQRAQLEEAAGYNPLEEAEIRSVSETGGEKGVKAERYDLIPVEALAQVAALYGKGAAKYAEHNWRKGYEWSKSYAALQRHSNAFWAGEDIDPEMQLPHMAAVAFHALTLLTFMQEQPGFDDRFKA